jgi:hypothetical protein
MITQNIFESLILTNTIVAAFCIILLVTFTIFIILFLVPTLRRRWLGKKKKEESTFSEISSLSRQPSFHQFTLGSSRLNPLFEPAAGTTTTTTTTQFGTLFHPHATTATLLHPTIWTSTNPTSASSSTPAQVQPSLLPAQSPTTTATTNQKSPRKP